MKILKIYLCRNEETNNNMIIDYYSFTKDINYNHNVKTFCLSALDFSYFRYFDQIIVYGKTKYIIFDKPLQNSKIINYNVYTNSNEKLTIYHKELRMAHNLYKLIIHNHFNLND